MDVSRASSIAPRRLREREYAVGLRSNRWLTGFHRFCHEKSGRDRCRGVPCSVRRDEQGCKQR